MIQADLLLTFDKKLAASVAQRKKCGVLLLRLGAVAPSKVASIVLHLLTNRQGLDSAYVVFSENGIRVRSY